MYLEEFPELQTQTNHVPNGATLAPAPPARDPSKPKITDQALDILSKATAPMKSGDVFRAMQTLPKPATRNDTSVYTSLAHLAAKGLLKRTDDGYQMNGKGRKALEELQAAEPTGGQA